MIKRTADLDVAAGGAGDARNPVVVTGAAGFVGAHLVRALVHRGRTVVATDLAQALPAPVLAGLDSERATYVSGDLCDETTLDAVFGGPAPFDVIHVAAVNRFAQLGRALGEDAATPAEALKSFEINAMASWRICRRLAEAGVLGRLLHISTRAVFGGRTASPEPVAEDATPSPAGIYGASKAAAEVGVLTFRDEFSMDAAVVRITGAFGPWQGPVSWLGRIVEAIGAGRPYHIDSGRDDAYELTYVKDTVRGLVTLLEAPQLRHPVYHVSSGRMETLGEVAQAMCAAQADADVAFGPSTSLSARRTPLGGARIAAELGFGAHWTLPEAVADYLAVELGASYGREALDGPNPRNDEWKETTCAS